MMRSHFARESVTPVTSDDESLRALSTQRSGRQPSHLGGQFSSLHLLKGNADFVPVFEFDSSFCSNS